VKFVIYSCLNCEMCRKGYESLCFNSKFGGLGYEGTFQQYVKSYLNSVTPIPDKVTSEEACPVLCAGVTVYRAIREAETRVRDWIVIPGAGGGLGHLAIQYATAKGLRVLAVDAAEKRKICLELGAEKFIDFKESGDDLVKHIIEATDGRGPHCALIAAASPKAYAQAVMYVRPSGYVMAVGLSGDGMAQLPINRFVVAGLKMVGGLTGNRQDVIEALELVAAGKVKVIHEVRPMSEVNGVIEDMRKGAILGRVVLDIAK